MFFQWMLPCLLLACGGYFTVFSKFYAFKNIGRAFRTLFQISHKNNGITAFSSLCTMLGATVGVGNIVGVSAAVTQGGSGALFWMLIAAFLGMSAKFAENALGAVYRIKDGKGNRIGGPFAYIEHGLGNRYRCLAVLYACAVILTGVLGMGTIIQSGSVIASAEQMVNASGMLFKIILSAGLTVLVGTVILGGTKRISKVSETIVPIMSVAYILACGVILFRFRGQLPRVMVNVFKDAWCMDAAVGALKGIALKNVILLGVQRGVFSNEAGLGTSAISAAAAENDDAVLLGYTGIVSVFIDTIVLCTLTGLTVLVTGSNNGSGLASAVGCWEIGLFPEAKYILLLFLMVFGFTSILGWNFFVERSAAYLFRDARLIKLVQILYLAAVFLGPFLSEDFAWKMADWLNIFLAAPNLIALWLLRKKVLRLMR